MDYFKLMYLKGLVMIFCRRRLFMVINMIPVSAKNLKQCKENKRNVLKYLSRLIINMS